jgi:hypothetical protein
MRSPRARAGVHCTTRSFRLPCRGSEPAETPRSSRAEARRAHGSAGASRPTRRPGGFVGVRRRAGRPSGSGAAPTSTADVDRRPRPPTSTADLDRRPRPPTSTADLDRRADVDDRRRRGARPDVRRASSFRALRRAAKPRTEARLGAPMRSPRVRVGVWPRSTRRETPSPVFCPRRRAAKLPRRRPPRACERRGVAKHPRRGPPRAGERRRTRALTLAARMGAPGRRVRRDGPAASSGRCGARDVRRGREPRRPRTPRSASGEPKCVVRPLRCAPANDPLSWPA